MRLAAQGGFMNVFDGLVYDHTEKHWPGAYRSKFQFFEKAILLSAVFVDSDV